VRLVAVLATAIAVIVPSASLAGRSRPVGNVTTVYSEVHVGRTLLGNRSSADLFAGSVVSTNRGGSANLTLKANRTGCTVRPRAKLAVAPKKSALFHLFTGEVICSTGDNRHFVVSGPKWKLLSDDPVFAMSVGKRQTVIKVRRGFVVLSGRHGDRAAVVIGRNQQATIAVGGDPRPPDKIAVTAPERIVFEALEAKLPPPDTKPPAATITGGPSDSTPESSATFRFAAGESHVAFACALDGGAYHHCSSGVTFRGLREGAHTFSVVAVDAAGNVGPPATRAWAIDATAPTSGIACDGAPCTDKWYGHGVTVTLSSTDGATIRYTLDGSDPSETNGQTYTASFVVSAPTTVTWRAYDAAGNAEEPQRQALSVDTVAPTVSITSPKSGSTVHGTATLAASASDNVRVERVDFLVDGKTVGSASSAPYQIVTTFGPGSQGRHTVTARAFDTAGNSADSTAKFIVALPDLTVSVDSSSIYSSCTDSTCATSVTYVSFTIDNLTSTAAGSFTVSIEASFGASRSFSVSGLAGGASRTFQDEALPPGDYCSSDCTVTVTVDSDDEVAESREDNNADEQSPSG